MMTVRSTAAVVPQLPVPVAVLSKLSPAPKAEFWGEEESLPYQGRRHLLVS